MDELHDAIQDAQYIGAVKNAQRCPTAPFYTPTSLELHHFMEKQEKLFGKDWLSLEFILHEPLGFYFFTRYCQAEQQGQLKLAFLVDLTRFRALREDDYRIQKALELYNRYCYTGNAKSAFDGEEFMRGSSSSSIAMTPSISPTATLCLDCSPNSSFSSAYSLSIGQFAKKLHVAQCNNDSITFWKKSASNITYAEALALYRKAACDKSALGVSGEIVQRLNHYLSKTQEEHENCSKSNEKAIAHENDEQLTGNLETNGLDRLFVELEACVLQSLEQKHLEKFRTSVFYRRLISFLYLQQTRKVCEKDFTILRILGRGGFGVVNGCIKRTCAALYAMKVMNKKMIKRKHAEKLCLAERKILSMACSPFIVCLKYAFQTTDDLYLVLNLRTGGDLSYHLNRCRFTEEQVRFWSAQILLGLQHLHEKNIAYRDLKPENILLDENGNCCISDLGLAVEVTPTLAGRCGTRGYWAPEMLVRDENNERITYTQVVDWWSYGCLVYELLYGKCPFRTSRAKALHEDKQVAYDKATMELTPVYDPRYFSIEAADLIQKLLIRDPKARLGSNGAEEVKSHPFFASINWTDVETLSVTPPYVPHNEINAASQSDIGSFDVSATNRLQLTEQDKLLYSLWDYVNPDVFQRECIEYLEWEIKNGPCVLASSPQACCILL